MESNTETDQSGIIPLEGRKWVVPFAHFAHPQEAPEALPPCPLGLAQLPLLVYLARIWGESLLSWHLANSQYSAKVITLSTISMRTKESSKFPSNRNQGPLATRVKHPFKHGKRWLIEFNFTLIMMQQIEVIFRATIISFPSVPLPSIFHYLLSCHMRIIY